MLDAKAVAAMENPYTPFRLRSLLYALYIGGEAVRLAKHWQTFPRWYSGLALVAIAFVIAMWIRFLKLEQSQPEGLTNKQANSMLLGAMLTYSLVDFLIYQVWVV